METRARDLAREAKDNVKEAAQQWSEKAKSAGTAAYQAAQTKVRSGAQATDVAIRNYPYAALGIAIGTGLLIGFLAKRR
jgi:ElaB/YqjD/DUF883 family membrane-anchored ribosome-binding protein